MENHISIDLKIASKCKNEIEAAIYESMSLMEQGNIERLHIKKLVSDEDITVHLLNDAVKAVTGYGFKTNAQFHVMEMGRDHILIRSL